MENKCQYCEGTGRARSFDAPCNGCDGDGKLVEAFFTCGVKGCSHVVTVSDPLDIRRYDSDKRSMVDHYRWEHADMIGTRRSTPGVAFSDYYEYRPIPDDIGPSFTYRGEVSTWAEICEIEGRV